MTDLASVSRQELAQRRQQLRRQRRMQLLQSIWRLVAVSGMTAGLLWVATQPVWVIHDPQQIQIQGNDILSTEAIREMLPIDYPQPLLQMQPHLLSEHLMTQAPIAKAVVIRHLFPPRLEVQVDERVPVALVVPDGGQKAPEGQTAGAVAAGLTTQVGLIDEYGVWMSQSSFAKIQEAANLPTLKVRGLREQYIALWPAIYKAIQRSPVSISELDLRDPRNLILQTDLGQVYLGPYTDQFEAQLVILDQMRNYGARLKRDQVDYLDLSNPDQPVVKMRNSSP